MRTAVLLLLVICFGLGLLTYFQSATLREQRAQILQLNVKVQSMPKNATLDLQEKCARQAREEFKLYGWDKRETAALSNHYNATVNKCFMEIAAADTKSVRGEMVESKTVSDAFEGKVVGSYIWGTQKNKKYWEVPPLQCKVTLTSGEEKICHSEKEFDEMVKQYME